MRRTLTELSNSLRFLLKRKSKQQSLDDEIQFHIQEAIDENVANGMNPKEARKAALKEFGNGGSIAEECRDSWGNRHLMNIIRDIRYTLRAFKKEKTFFIAITLTLSICFSGNILIVSILNSVYFNPGLYPNEERIVRVADSFTGSETRNTWYTAPLYYLERKEQSQLIENIGAYESRFATLSETGPQPNPVYNLFFRISPSLLDTLEVEPLIGRNFREEETQRANDTVAILDYKLWQSRFGGDPTILDKTIFLDGRAYTIIGVMPEGFTIPSAYQHPSKERRISHPVYIPLTELPWFRTANGKLRVFFGSLARVAPGVTSEALQREFEVIAERNAPLFPEAQQYEIDNHHRIKVATLHEDLIRNSKQELMLLQLAMLTLLILGCVNIASLVLNRNYGRSQELHVKHHLGAGMSRIFQQILTESFLFSILGGVISIPLTVLGFQALDDMGLFTHLLVDPEFRWGTGLFLTIAALTTFAGVLTGVISLLPMSLKNQFSGVSSNATRSSTAGLRFKTGQYLLVTCQVGITFVILLFGGVLIKSFLELRNTETGFDSENIITGIVRPSRPAYQAEDQRRFMSEFRRRVSELPGIISAGIQFYPPLKWEGNSSVRFITEPQWQQGIGDAHSGILDSTDPHIFDTLGISVLRGRTFTQSDLENMLPVVVIDRKVADTLFPNEDPIGKRILVQNEFLYSGVEQMTEEDLHEIIGVVENVSRVSVISPPQAGTVYMHVYRQIPGWMSIVAKTKTDPHLVVESIKTTLASMDPNLSLGRVESMSEIVSQNYQTRYYLMVLILVVAAMALLICTIGLFGVISYVVATQTKEFGIRMSLGAVPRQIHQGVIHKWMRILALGILGGAVASLFILPGFAHLFYRTPAINFTALLSVSLFMSLVVYTSAYLSSKSSTKIHPMEALRTE